jgi:hypothetical protein
MEYVEDDFGSHAIHRESDYTLCGTARANTKPVDSTEPTCNICRGIEYL